MKCCFHKWKKTKLENTLLYLWIRVAFSWGVDFSRNMEPESFLKGFILETVTIENKDLRLSKRTLFCCMASISTILLSYWWSWSILWEAFFLGEESTWFVSVTGGWSLLTTGRWCQSVVSGLKLGRAHCLNRTEEVTRGFTFKVDEVQIRVWDAESNLHGSNLAKGCHLTRQLAVLNRFVARGVLVNISLLVKRLLLREMSLSYLT